MKSLNLVYILTKSNVYVITQHIFLTHYKTHFVKIKRIISYRTLKKNKAFQTILATKFCLLYVIPIMRYVGDITNYIEAFELIQILGPWTFTMINGIINQLLKNV